MMLHVLRRILSRSTPDTAAARPFAPRLPLCWSCDVCQDWRPDAKISVFTTEVSALYGLQPGVMRENVRYCNDRPECIAQARTKRLIELRLAEAGKAAR
jgi:hypothetical protein